MRHHINTDKMEYIIAENIRRVDSYKYLRLKNTTNETSEVEIKVRIKQEKLVNQ